MSNLIIAGKEFKSRLIVGTSRYPDPHTMLQSLEASGTDFITVSIRRLNLTSANGQESIMNMIDMNKYSILPNTAGCFTAKEKKNNEEANFMHCASLQNLMSKLEASSAFRRATE